MISSNSTEDGGAGWAECTFEDVAEVQLGKMLDRLKNEGEPAAYLRNINVRWGAFDLGDLAEMRMSAEDHLAFRIRDGDLMVCEGGEPGRAAVWRLGETTLTFQKALMRVRPHPSVQPEFLKAILEHAADNGSLAAHLTGTTIKHLPQNVLRRFSIALPPSAEQRRIVAKLDALTARTARARAELDRIPALARRYKQAVLSAAFSGALSPGEPAAVFHPIELSEVLVSTFYGPRFAKDSYDATGVPTLRTTDFNDWGRVVSKNPPCVRVTPAELIKWGLIDGDLLITRTGSIGKCAVYEASMGPALPSAYLIRTRLDLSRIDPTFALFFLLSPSGQEQLGLGITAVTQPNINAGVIERLRLPVPSLTVQRQIAKRVGSFLKEIDRLTAEAAAALRLLDRLDQAVLAKAFRGELVPQDPADEPASVLLDRIRAERAVAPMARRGRRTSTGAAA